MNTIEIINSFFPQVSKAKNKKMMKDKFGYN